MAIINGTTGNDTLNGTGEADVIYALQGQDTVNGGAGDDSIGTLYDGKDTIDGGAGIDIWYGDFTKVANGIGVKFGLGDNGAETVGNEGTKVRNVEVVSIIGSLYDDVLQGGSGNDLLFGATGFDTLVGHGGDDYLDGGDGNDYLFGQDGDDKLFGEAGDDYLYGSAGIDQMAGGDGFDRVDYFYNGPSSGGVVASLATGGISGVAAGDTYTEVEALGGTNFKDTLIGSDQADLLYGYDGADLLVGGLGADTLQGNQGNDLLVGGTGADVLDGFLGTDTASYAASNSYVDVRLDSGMAGFGGHAMGDVLTDIENLIGSAFGDTLVGSAGANTLDGGAAGDGLDGGAGNDLLRGGAGTDSLLGNAGDDTLEGGTEGDTLNGYDGIDTVSYAGSAAGVRVNLGTGLADGGDATGDTLLYDENLTGSAFNDSLVGNAGVNRLIGGAGRDGLAGAAGDDRIEGGEGNDVLIGGAGRDLLIGGAGNDTFDFNAVGESAVGSARDVITDFTHLSDRIDLATIDANAGATGDQAFSFIGAGALTGAAGELRVNASGTLMGDVNGDKLADFQIGLGTGVVLTSADFVL